MHYRTVATTGVIAVAMLAGACNRNSAESREDAARPAESANERSTDLQREREDAISRLSERVAGIERKYAEANQKVVSGSRTATAGLREELKEDVQNVKQAVTDLGTTTPDNWWQRHETAMSRTADDVEADVRRLAGKVAPARPAATTTGTSGEEVSTEPFTSRRDRFVAELRARVDAMEAALDEVKARGPQQTELEDTRARIKKLRDDVDKLRSASADEWWDLSKTRVTEYVDRVEGSVSRLDDDKR